MGCKAVECEFNIKQIEGCALLGYFPAAHLDAEGKCEYYKKREEKKINRESNELNEKKWRVNENGKDYFGDN